MKGRILPVCIFLLILVIISSCTRNTPEISGSEDKEDSKSSPLSVVNQVFKARSEGDRETFNSLIYENREYLWDEFINCDGIIPTYYSTESRTAYDDKPYSLISVSDGTNISGSFGVIYDDGKWSLFDISGKLQCRIDPIDIPATQGQLSDYDSTKPKTYYNIYQGSLAEYGDLVGHAGVSSPKNTLIDMYNDYHSPVILSGEFFDDKGTRLFYSRNYQFDRNAIFFQSDNNLLNAIDITNGETLWQVEIEGILIGQGETTVLIFTYDNRIYGLNKKTGEESWKIILGLMFSEDEEYLTIPFAQYYEEKIYVPLNSDCGEMNNLRFINITESTGESYVTTCNTDAYADRVLAFSNGLFVADDSTIAAYNPNDGSVVWSVDPVSISYSSTGENYLEILDFDTENNVIYFQTLFGRGYGRNELYAVNIMTGDYIWGGGLFESNGMQEYHEQEPSTHFNDVQWGVGNFHLTTNYVYYFTDNEILFIDKKSGKLINRLVLEKKYAPFFSDSGLMLYYQNLRVAQGVDPSTGEVIWENDEIPIPEIDPLTLYYISYENIIIFLDKNTEEFVAYDQLTGMELWREILNVFYLRPMKELVIGDIFGDPILFLQEEQGKTNIWTINPFSGDIKNIIGPVYLENYSGKLLSLEEINENTYILCNEKLLTVVKNQ